MNIAIVKESLTGERRVAGSPESVRTIARLGYEVLVETGAGAAAGFPDALFAETGARIVPRDEAWRADIVLKVNAPTEEELKSMRSGCTLISFLNPAQNQGLLALAAERNIQLLAMDAVPRISRAQAMDALSSMANIAGYRAVIEAAHAFGRFLSGQITAAGKIPPAKVLVIGAGVAGLAAIGAAGSLGAIVRAFDARPEVKEQIESMGAEFLELDYEEDVSSSDGYAKEMSQAFIDAEMALFRAQAADVDIIITTAMIPGKPAPKLILKDMVEAMKPGSVIVDLAAAGGGNCELTEAGKVVEHRGVSIIGYTDLPSRLPAQSSRLYGNNLANLLRLLTPEKNGELVIDFEDVIVRSITVTREGQITWPPPKVAVSAKKAPTEDKAPTAPTGTEAAAKSSSKPWLKPLLLLGAVAGYTAVAASAPPAFLSHFTVFVLAVVVGYYVVWNVTHALHTPLMSVTNAISGIIVIGALLQVSSPEPIIRWLALAAIFVASINVFGGFVVTGRMLKMFRREGEE
jgi:NAD(P) transhydrogenase subunit alpha